MSAPIYTIPAGAASSIVANTLTYILGAKAHANSGLLVKEAFVAFDGIAAASVPAIVELCYCTWATNGPGTNSTSVTAIQKSGRVIAAGFTAGRTWTVAPTVVTPIAEFLIHPQGGFYYASAFGDEADCALAEGFVIRVLTPAAAPTVNARTFLAVARI